MTADLVGLFARAVDGFGRRFEAIGPDQWGAPTPDAEWDVRLLANHVLVEGLWAPPLLDGLTIADIGDRFDGDQLGDDPQATWRAASAAAIAAVRRDGALDGSVHVSFGDIPATEYVTQVLCDHVIHSWDLSRGIGADDQLDDDLVEFAWAYFEPNAEAWRAGGSFGPKVELPPGADLQSRLLALTGRRPRP